MILKLNATEIIACAVDKHVRTNVNADNMTIRINKIRTVARRMEEEMPTLLTACDMVAIEDCQYSFKKNMTIKASAIHITKVREINPRLSRYLPEHNLYIKLIDKI